MQWDQRTGSENSGREKRQAEREREEVVVKGVATRLQWRTKIGREDVRGFS